MMPDPMHFIYISSVVLFLKTPRPPHEFAALRYRATSARAGLEKLDKSEGGLK